MPSPAFGNDAVEFGGARDICCAHGCRADSVFVSREVPLCERHSIRAYGHIIEFIRLHGQNRPPRPMDERIPGVLGIPLVEKTWHVYYVQFGDRVKIGVTSNLVRRLDELPWDKLLTVEKGDREVEQERHKQFASDRVNGEWFRMSNEIVRHINSVIERERDELGPGMRRFLHMHRFVWPEKSRSA